jgi:hypothetical protein
VRCAVCGRRLDSHWIQGRAGYRCRHGRNSARPPALDEPKILCVREDVLVRELLNRLLPDRVTLIEPGGFATLWTGPGSSSSTSEPGCQRTRAGARAASSADRLPGDPHVSVATALEPTRRVVKG